MEFTSILRGLNMRSVVAGCVMLANLSLGMNSFSDSSQTSGINDAPTEPVAIKRDPFWPVGYVPEKIRNAEQAEVDLEQENLKGNNNWDQAMKQVVINGVSSRAGSEAYAVINGQIRTVGDTITVNYHRNIYTWAVDRITVPGSVKLRRVSVQ